MNTIKEEQLNRYFEHAMSGGEEQNFLISVAASDEMRIAFRSQLELMKAVRSDKDELRVGVSGQPVAHVRNRTLTALGLSATAVTPFIEHELTRSSAGVQAAEVAVGPMGWLSKAVSFFRRPALALTGGLALGVLSTTAVMHYTAPNNGSAIIKTAPSPTAETKTILRPQDDRSSNEPLAPSKALNSSDHSANMAQHHATHNGHTVASHTARSAATVATPSSIPEISRSDAATMKSKKATITNTNDSAKN